LSAQVIDYNATQSRSRFNLSTSTTIPHATRRLIFATIRLNTGASRDVAINKVELTGQLCDVMIPKTLPSNPARGALD
jgi:hypothetical protein